MLEAKMGVLRGTGSAINVSLGFIPDLVIITNLTDGDRLDYGYPSINAIPFTSGSLALKPFVDTIKGATSGATAKVTDFIIDTGSVAGGDAAGWIFIDVESKVGTFQTENIYCSSDGTSGTDDATITVDVNYTSVIDTAVAKSTTNALITPYVGSSGSAAKGFTVGSTVSEDAKLLHYVAFRMGAGASSLVDNSL